MRAAARLANAHDVQAEDAADGEAHVGGRVWPRSPSRNGSCFVKGPCTEKKSWSPAERAFSVPTSASGWWQTAQMSCASTTLFTGSRNNIAGLLGHPQFELVREDVTNPLKMEVDLIYHLACPASPVHYQRNPVRTIRTAVEGTLNVLEAAREAGARVLLASTSEVYGDPAIHPQEESYWGNVNPIGPRACYDEGKRCAEALAVSYAAQYGVEVRIARIFNTYGPRLQEHDGRGSSRTSSFRRCGAIRSRCMAPGRKHGRFATYRISSRGSSA